jgi:hypothetical protein
VKVIVYLLLLLVIAFPTAVHAKELKKGMSFLAARKLLIHKGWRPIKSNADYGGTEKILINGHIKEVESCAMDRAVCIFNYRKVDKCLRLFTQGEEIKDMRVYEWTNDCPEGD